MRPQRSCAKNIDYAAIVKTPEVVSTTNNNSYHFGVILLSKLVVYCPIAQVRRVSRLALAKCLPSMDNIPPSTHGKKKALESPEEQLNKRKRQSKQEPQRTITEVSKKDEHTISEPEPIKTSKKDPPTKKPKLDESRPPEKEKKGKTTEQASQHDKENREETTKQRKAASEVKKSDEESVVEEERLTKNQKQTKPAQPSQPPISPQPPQPSQPASQPSKVPKSTPPSQSSQSCPQPPASRAIPQISQSTQVSPLPRAPLSHRRSPPHDPSAKATKSTGK
jgi:hypothetical protein